MTTSALPIPPRAAILYDNATGQEIPIPGLTNAIAASGDDAFPLLSTRPAGTPLDSKSFDKASWGPTRLSPTGLGLVFNIEDLAPGSPANNLVELHRGTVNKNVYPQYSWDSQGCLVVSQTNFLTPLEQELYFLQTGKTITAQQVASLNNNQVTALSNWINDNVGCLISSTDTVPQAKIDVSVDASTGITFSLTPRSLEKEVAALYAVTDNTNGMVTTREALIPAGSTSVTIPFSQLFQKNVQKPSGAPNGNQLISNTPSLTQYSGTFYKTLPTNPSDSYTVQLLGYEVQFHAGMIDPAKAWYFDGQVNDPTTGISPFNLDASNAPKAPRPRRRSP